MVAVRNRISKNVQEKSIFDDCSALVSSSTTYNQGDLLVVASNALTTVTTGELGTYFAGISRQSTLSGIPTGPYSTDNQASISAPALIGPAYGVEVQLVLKTSDAINPGDKVYIDGASGTHHVTVTQIQAQNGNPAASAIGIYNGPAIASASSGQQITVLIGCNYPVGTLQF